MANTLNDRINHVFSLRNTRLAEQKKLDAMKAEEDLEMNTILSELIEGDLYILSTGIAKVTVKETIEPEITDWATFQAYIKETGQLDLLQKRPMVSAIKARWETGDDVPGVERMVGSKLVLSAVKS
jgi:hypothetical protein